MRLTGGSITTHKKASLTYVVNQRNEDESDEPMLTLNRIGRISVAIVIAGCATSTTMARIDNIPMYGQPATPRPETLQKADEDFIKRAIAGFGGSREAASEAWYAEGDRFIRELNLDYAMRRYNQSWLLNPKNYQPYWGFARVMVQQDRFKKAIRYFETALKLCNDDYQKVALLSDAGVAYSFSGNFEDANERFQESTTLDPKYANAWFRWSQSLHREGNFAEAWNKLKQARLLGASIPEAHLRALSDQMPEPQ